MTGISKVFRSVDQLSLQLVSEEIAKQIKTTPVWLFHGQMGAGKTTLIKAVCLQLGVDDVMSSPTFSIVNEYHTGTNGKVYHFDFYRLRQESEAFDIGAEEYFYSGFPCLIEWPEKIPSLIPDQVGEVNITIENETLRTIAIQIR